MTLGSVGSLNTQGEHNPDQVDSTPKRLDPSLLHCQALSRQSSHTVTKPYDHVLIGC